MLLSIVKGVKVLPLVTMVMVKEECSQSRQELRRCRVGLMDCKEVFREDSTLVSRDKEDSILV